MIQGMNRSWIQNPQGIGSPSPQWFGPMRAPTQKWDWLNQGQPSQVPGSRGNVFDPSGTMGPPMIQDPMMAPMPPNPNNWTGMGAPQGMDELELFRKRYGVNPNPPRMRGIGGGNMNFQPHMYGGG